MKEKRGKKSQRRVEKRKRKEKKSEDYCVTLKTKNYLKLFLSAHAQTSKVNISHLDQKAVVLYLFIYLQFIFFSLVRIRIPMQVKQKASNRYVYVSEIAQTTIVFKT